jgi:cobalt/nickel transport protein
MKKRELLLMFGLVSILFTAPAFAHFQMLHTSKSALENGGEMSLKLVFTHPFEGDHVMDMDPVQEFYVVHQRGEEGEPHKTDLKEYLKAITWRGLGNAEGKAFEANLPARVVRSIGDYVFVLIPGPYYEKADEGYIQQFTKMIVNVGGMPGNWSEPLGLPAEIVPLNKPYANWTGGVFTGVVMSGGKPVPNIEVEIEYLNVDVDSAANAFVGEPRIEAPHPAFETMTVMADDQGRFTIGLPKAGWWGIAVPDVVELEYKGKEMVQEAVLWIQVTDIP